jgi:hypothetical protein
VYKRQLLRYAPPIVARDWGKEAQIRMRVGESGDFLLDILKSFREWAL